MKGKAHAVEYDVSWNERVAGKKFLWRGKEETRPRAKARC
jgi:hypothetical protein